MGVMDKITNLPKSMLKKVSYSSNNISNYNSNAYGTGTYDSVDDLLKEHQGRYSYHEYQKIMEDTQVGVAIDILISFLLSKNYIITSNSDNELDMEAAKFITDMFDNMSTPFRKVRRDMYTSIPYGFAALEKVYTIDNEGRIAIDSIHGIHMKTLQNNPFIKDENGELIGIHQQSVNGSTDIPIEKVMLIRYNNEFDELYGRSILNRVAKYPKIKNNIIKWLITFLHKHENPVTYAKIGSNSQFKRDILKMLDEIAEGRTNMTIGADDDLGTLESSHRGEAFFNSLHYFDNLIFRGLFLGSLLLGDGGQTGSYAQSNTQLKVANNIFDGMHQDMAFDVQAEINQLIEWNFGHTAKAPTFKFEKFTEKDLLGLLNALQPYASNMTIDTDSAWFKELIAKIVKELADIKDDTDSIGESVDSDVDYGMQPPLPGEEEAVAIVNQQLEGII